MTKKSNEPIITEGNWPDHDNWVKRYVLTPKDPEKGKIFLLGEWKQTENKDPKNAT